jgi:hypothetical protein
LGLLVNSAALTLTYSDDNSLIDYLINQTVTRRFEFDFVTVGHPVECISRDSRQRQSFGELLFSIDLGANDFCQFQIIKPFHHCFVNIGWHASGRK